MGGGLLLSYSKPGGAITIGSPEDYIEIKYTPIKKATLTDTNMSTCGIASHPAYADSTKMGLELYNNLVMPGGIVNNQYCLMQMNNLPKIGNATIKKARLHLNTSSTEHPAIMAKEITSQWYPGFTSWNSRPAFGDQVISAGTASTAGYDFDLTSLVQQWYSTGVNHGIQFSLAEYGYYDGIKKLVQPLLLNTLQINHGQ